MAEPPASLARWTAKKAARASVGALGAGVSRAAPRPGPAVRVVTYHRFGPAHRQPFTLQADSFERQVAWLASEGRLVSLTELEAMLAGTQPFRDGAVLVTMDDGDPSVLHTAVPILSRHKAPSVLFALPASTDAFTCLTPAELRETAAAGVDIGSHSVSHTSFGALPAARAREEARASRERLEDIVGRPVTAFAYPFGTYADFSAESRAVLEEAGYRTAFTSVHGAVSAGADPLELPRLKVESGDPDWLFPALCDGAMDYWRHLDAAIHKRPSAVRLAQAG